VSDGENNRSLAGLWNRARRFLPGGVRPDSDGWEPAGGGSIHPSRTLQPFPEPMRDIEVVRSPLEVLQSHLLAHHQREMLLRRPLAPGKEG
jgi:hypothetical protein